MDLNLNNLKQLFDAIMDQTLLGMLLRLKVE